MSTANERTLKAGRFLGVLAAFAGWTMLMLSGTKLIFGPGLEEAQARYAGRLEAMPAGHWSGVVMGLVLLLPGLWLYVRARGLENALAELAPGDADPKAIQFVKTMNVVVIVALSIAVGAILLSAALSP